MELGKKNPKPLTDETGECPNPDGPKNDPLKKPDIIF
jgi:hypothetical protein